jgi:hypothetical protein
MFGNMDPCRRQCRSSWRRDSKTLDGTTEDTNAKTTNTSRSSFGKVCRSHDSCLANSETHDDSSCKGLSIITCRCDEYYDAHNPGHAKLTSLPQQVRPLKSEIANCETLKSELPKY